MKHYKPTQHGIVHNAYCMVYGIGFVYGKQIVKVFDWFGEKLVNLIDKSDFFAGVIWTYTVMTVWELITR